MLLGFIIVISVFFVKDFVIVLHEFVLRRIMAIVIDGLSCAHFVFFCCDYVRLRTSKELTAGDV